MFGDNDDVNDKDNGNGIGNDNGNGNDALLSKSRKTVLLESIIHM